MYYNAELRRQLCLNKVYDNADDDDDWRLRHDTDASCRKCR